MGPGDPSPAGRCSTQRGQNEQKLFPIVTGGHNMAIFSAEDESTSFCVHCGRPLPWYLVDKDMVLHMRMIEKIVS